MFTIYNDFTAQWPCHIWTFTFHSHTRWSWVQMQIWLAVVWVLLDVLLAIISLNLMACLFSWMLHHLELCTLVSWQIPLCLSIWLWNLDIILINSHICKSELIFLMFHIAKFMCIERVENLRGRFDFIAAQISTIYNI